MRCVSRSTVRPLLPLVCLALLGCGDNQDTAKQDPAKQDTAKQDTAKHPEAALPAEGRRTAAAGIGIADTADTNTDPDVAAVQVPGLDAEGFDALIKETAASGRVLVVDFWGTWCPPCVELFDPLHEAIEALGPRARMVSVAWAFEEDLIAEKNFLAERHAAEDAFHISFKTDLDAFHDHVGKKLQDPAGAGVYPLVMVFAPDGRLAAEFSAATGGIEAEAIAQAARRVLPG